MNWNSDILWRIIEVLFTLTGYIISWTIYVKSNKTKTLYISYDSKTLISERITSYKNLKLYYNKKHIKNLICSTISIHNIGNQTIEDSDMSPSSHITISTTKKFLFNNVNDYDISSSNSNVSLSLRKINKSEIELYFDFLKPEDVINISLLHNGKISIKGELINGYIEIENHYSKRRKRVDNIKKWVIWILFLLPVIQLTLIIILFIVK